MTKQNDETERFIAGYCAKMGITREQFDAEGALKQAQIEALWVLAQAGEENPVVPEGLPGAGWPLRNLPDALHEQLVALQMEFDEIMPGTFFPADDDGAEVVTGDPRRFGWKF